MWDVAVITAGPNAHPLMIILKQLFFQIYFLEPQCVPLTRALSQIQSQGMVQQQEHWETLVPKLALLLSV